MSRILYHHDWTDVEDWARNIAELADLTDDEIQQLERCPQQSAASTERVSHATPPVQSASLMTRTHQGLQGLRDIFRFGLRRAY